MPLETIQETKYLILIFQYWMVLTQSCTSEAVLEGLNSISTDEISAIVKASPAGKAHQLAAMLLQLSNPRDTTFIAFISKLNTV